MTELQLSEHAAPPPQDGIGGRFLIDWKTVAGLLIAAFLAWAAIDRRVSLIEAKNDAIEAQIREIRADVKELLRRP